jgi:hypothetical protein
MRQDGGRRKALSAMSTVCAPWWQAGADSSKDEGWNFFLFGLAKG